MSYEPVFRLDEIAKLCAAKSVLHLGFIQHSLWRAKIKEGLWLHNELLAVAKRAVGVDYLEQEVACIREEIGCECYYGDVTRLGDLDLEEQFDVILCGELIEHIDNPGLLLDGVKRFCHNSTILIITTPNPWSRERIRLSRSGRPENEWLNEEHVAWYSLQTLTQLLARHGFAVTSAGYYFEQRCPYGPSRGFAQRLKHTLRVAAKRVMTRRQLQDGLFVVASLQNNPDRPQ